MVDRCTNPNACEFKNYGGRGIVVCDSWRHSFPNFLSDMGHRPSRKHSIDRIDNSLGYCPENCRWATIVTQARNRRNNRILTHDGKSMCIAEWAEATGIRQANIVNRINNLGWSVERALTTKKR